MRGLTLFIKDLRKCKGKEEELKRINQELANIRSKFSGNKPLNGYHKKKYVCKLLFMFLLGHKNEFGCIEAVNLLSSNAYSEKQIGYLFISVVMGNNHNFTPLVINSIKNDLSSENKFFQNLALQFVANNISIDIADTVVEQVSELLFSNETVDFVKQTAALTLLQILRIKRDFTFDEVQANGIINLISHHSLGVVTASVSLVDFLAKNFTSEFQSCLSHCIVRLHKIVTPTFVDFQDYSYYCTSPPWLIVKLLRILQNFRTPSNVCLKARLKESLDLILNKAQEAPKSKKLEHNNAKYAVIFEAISLIIQMDLDVPTLYRAINILGSALNQKESNIRFMALDIMAELSNNEICLTNLKAQWKSIVNTLRKETDITIKKRAIDLLYTICDMDNVKPIVDEMLYFLNDEIDYSVEVVLKAAALAEQFCKNSQWYIDTIINMLKICGDNVDDSIWYTLVKVVTENGLIQEYAARASYAVLNDRSSPEAVVKAAGYILGEFGYLIAKDPISSHVKQLSILRERYSNCSHSVRCILLTTYMKFLNVYPDLKNEIQSIFKDKSNSHSENEEIQQRAVEYLKLSEVASKRLLTTILEEIPSSERCESAVLTAIEKRRSQRFEIGRDERKLNKKNLTQFRSYCNLNLIPEISSKENVRMSRCVSHSNLYNASDTTTNLNLLMSVFKESPTPETVSGVLSAIPDPIPRIPSFHINEKFLHNLIFNETGVLFENHKIRILIQCEFRQHFGRFHLKYINKLMFPLTDFVVNGNFGSLENKCSIWFKPSNSVLQANGYMEQDIHLECLAEFLTKPSITLKFTYKKEQNEIKLMLPLTLNKFVEPSSMSQEAFYKRWQNFESAGQEVVKQFTAKYPMIYAVTRQRLRGFRVDVTENTDSVNFYCAGIFYTRTRRVGFLIKLERLFEDNKYCSSVRSSQFILCQAISDLLIQLF